MHFYGNFFILGHKNIWAISDKDKVIFLYACITLFFGNTSAEQI